MTARFVLSLDTEIAWGTFYWEGFHYYRRHFDDYRALITRFISLLERYEISATWAFVGHLFLHSCDGRHADVLRPRYGWFGGEDWHKYDPGTNWRTDPWWYAPDIVEAVVNMRTLQEIATHTFSHVVIGDPQCTPEIARSQVEACIRVAEPTGRRIESLVFPRDSVGHLDVFADLGIRTYRGVEQAWYFRFGPRAGKILHLIDQALALPSPVYDIAGLELNHGLLNVPSSQFLLAYDRYHGFVPTASRVAKVRRSIDRAVRGGAVFHLAFHPFHLGSSEQMFEVFERIFAHVARRRSEGSLAVATMGDIRRLYDATIRNRRSSNGEIAA